MLCNMFKEWKKKWNTNADKFRVKSIAKQIQNKTVKVTSQTHILLLLLSLTKA